MPDPDLTVYVRDLRGGRNGTDPPLHLGETQCVEALNVDWYQTAFARKRNGATSLGTLTAVFTAGRQIAALFRHVPGISEAAAELWAIDDTAAGPVWGRMAGGSTFAAVTPGDAVASAADAYTIQAATLNGKLFLTYKSAQDRLHCWDGTTHRRVGLATPATPTTSVAGGGVTDTRKYAVAYTVQSAGTTTRRSELSALTAAIVLSSQQVTLTKPAAISEGETHWELYGYSTADSYATGYLLATTAVATTTVTDNAATLSGAAPPPATTNTVPVSWKYLVADTGRLVGFGSWTAANKQSRAWFTPVVGASDIGDDERVPNTSTQKFFIDIGENDGDFPTGLATFGASVYCFKYRHLYKLIRTGDVNTPYVVFPVPGALGTIAQRSIVLGVDQQGQPALYWLSYLGPVRLGANGYEYCGYDIEDLWATVNLAATGVVAHGLYHMDRHQLWWWVATGSSAYPDTKLVFDTKLGRSTPQGVRDGWAKHDGSSAAATCSTLMSNTLGATMSLDLKPYIGRATAAPTIWRADSTATDDAGTTFQAYVKTRPYTPAGLGHNVGHGDPILVGKVSSGVTITVTTDRDFGAETLTASATLTAAGSESRVVKKVEGGRAAGAAVLQWQIGDAAAAANAWTLDALVVPIEPEEAQ